MEMEEILEKIYKSSIKLLVPQTREEVYETIVEEAKKLVEGQYGSIFLEKNDTLYRTYTSFPKLYTMKVRKRGYTYNVFSKNVPLIETIKNLSKVHPILAKTKSKTDLLIPLSFKNRPIGVLSIMSKPDQVFSKNDLMILKMFGPLATLAILNNQYVEETKQALKTRDLFISMASHELKTPLTTIYAYAQLLQTAVSKGTKINIKWMNLLTNELERLNKLVNELLQVEQISTGKLKFDIHKMNLGKTIKAGVNNFLITHPKRKIIFNARNNDIIIRADDNKITQVLINILNNAHKHSKITQEIIIDLFEDENFGYFSIKDFGRGIPGDDLSKIFDQFYRGRNNHHEGMGLGLYLVKRIVEQQNGAIHVESKLSSGTTFTVGFPKYTKRMDK